MNPRSVLATAAVLAIVVSPGAAQTLTQPSPQTRTPPPAVHEVATDRARENLRRLWRRL